MELSISPALEDPVRRALAEALRSRRASRDATPATTAWRREALREGVERDGAQAERYALSPRSTRGATRA